MLKNTPNLVASAIERSIPFEGGYKQRAAKTIGSDWLILKQIPGIVNKKRPPKPPIPITLTRTGLSELRIRFNFYDPFEIASGSYRQGIVWSRGA